MKLEIVASKNYCTLSVFKINGINADEDDFVIKYDHSPEMAYQYECGDMRADSIPASDEVLRKYGISSSEYIEIAEKVAEELSFGCCGLCT